MRANIPTHRLLCRDNVHSLDAQALDVCVSDFRAANHAQQNIGSYAVAFFHCQPQQLCQGMSTPPCGCASRSGLCCPLEMMSAGRKRTLLRDAEPPLVDLVKYGHARWAAYKPTASAACADSF